MVILEIGGSGIYCGIFFFFLPCTEPLFFSVRSRESLDSLMGYISKAEGVFCMTELVG
jgi:hypothetical protein